MNRKNLHLWKLRTRRNQVSRRVPDPPSSVCCCGWGCAIPPHAAVLFILIKGEKNYRRVYSPSTSKLFSVLNSTTTAFTFNLQHLKRDFSDKWLKSPLWGWQTLRCFRPFSRSGHSRERSRVLTQQRFSFCSADSGKAASCRSSAELFLSSAERCRSCFCGCHPCEAKNLQFCFRGSHEEVLT